MNKLHEWVNTGLLALAVLLIALVLVGGNQPVSTVSVGGSSDSGWNATGDGCISVDGTCIIDASGNLDGAITSTSFKIGANGSTFDTMKSGTCTLFSYDNTIAASTTDTVDCSGALNGLTAISGIASGDNCQLWATTTMSSTFLGLDIQFSHSSTTAGYIQAAVRNMTGDTYTWAAVASTSVRYFCTSQ